MVRHGFRNLPQVEGHQTTHSFDFNLVAEGVHPHPLMNVASGRTDPLDSSHGTGGFPEIKAGVHLMNV